jgi:Trypsin-like peptidase domain
MRQLKFFAIHVLALAIGVGTSSLIAAQRLGAREGQTEQKIAPGTLDQLPPAIKDQIEKATPEQKKQFEEQIKRIPPDKQKELAEEYLAASEEERAEMMSKAKAEIQHPSRPTTQHIIKGPEIPPGELLDFLDLRLSAANHSGLSATANAFLPAVRQLLPNTVVFRRRQVDGYSDRTFGSGILISKGLVLTARHVAEQVKADSSKISLIQIGHDGIRFVVPLEYLSTIELGPEPGSEDPDLELIKVRGSASAVDVAFLETTNVLDRIASIGTAELNALPAAAIGIITTAAKTRDLDDKLPFRRTVFGSTLTSFPGLSGAPVLSADGKIVAVILGGMKRYAPTGETEIVVPKGENWDTYPNWTWATPIGPVIAQIKDEIAKDR